MTTVDVRLVPRGGGRRLYAGGGMTGPGASLSSAIWGAMERGEIPQGRNGAEYDTVISGSLVCSLIDGMDERNDWVRGELAKLRDSIDPQETYDVSALEV